jgi:hypothetical protein
MLPIIQAARFFVCQVGYNFSVIYFLHASDISYILLKSNLVVMAVFATGVLWARHVRLLFSCRGKVKQ